ncbi:MAG: polysaccharide deacetylase family protein [Nitrosomonas sp.]|nr:polysaccharide deacetylase family protein [Nitrosomonas sp.]
MNNYRKKIWINRLAPFIQSSGLARLFRPFYGGIGHVLTFHRVIPPLDSPRIHNHHSLEISPEHLEEVIGYFAKKDYQFFSLDQLQAALDKGIVKKKFVVFTFDDGYQDVWQYAYPIFKRYKVPFAIYISTNFPDHTAILWWYMLENFVLRKEHISFCLSGKTYDIQCANQEEKEAAFANLRQIILNEPDQLKLPSILKTIFGDLYSVLMEDSQSLSLSWEQIRSLNQDPLVTIGAHTINHYPLSQLDETMLKEEVVGSRAEIEQEIQTPVRHFAYPFGKKGEASQREFAFVKQEGFSTATTTRIGNIFPAHKNFPTALPRISINEVSRSIVLNLQTSGLIPFIVNRGKRVVTD